MAQHSTAWHRITSCARGKDPANPGDSAGMCTSEPLLAALGIGCEELLELLRRSETDSIMSRDGGLIEVQNFQLEHHGSTVEAF